VYCLLYAGYYSGQIYSFLFDRSWNKQGQDKIAFDVSPDGKSVVSSSAKCDLFLLDTSTQKVREISDAALIERQPAFSPSGSDIVYAVGNEGDTSSHLFIRSLDSQKIQQLTRSARGLQPQSRACRAICGAFYPVFSAFLTGCVGNMPSVCPHTGLAWQTTSEASSRPRISR
jgi:hypothetical protein